MLIVFDHIACRMVNVGLMKPFSVVGTYAVAIFFFLSGYGVMYSYINKKNYLKSFIKNRILKIYGIFVSINILTMVVYYIFENAKYTFIDFLKYSIGYSLIDSALWYIIVLIFFYIMFYIVFRYSNEKYQILIMFIISCVYFIFGYKISLGSWWLNTNFCFTLGIIYIKHKEKILSFISKNYIICFLILSLTSVLTFQIRPTNTLIALICVSISTTSFVALVTIILFKVRVVNKITIFLGSLSFEIYLIHMKLINIIFKDNQVNKSFSIVIYLTVLILFSWLLNRVINKFART